MGGLVVVSRDLRAFLLRLAFLEFGFSCFSFNETFSTRMNDRWRVLFAGDVCGWAARTLNSCQTTKDFVSIQHFSLENLPTITSWRLPSVLPPTPFTNSPFYTGLTTQSPSIEVWSQVLFANWSTSIGVRAVDRFRLEFAIVAVTFYRRFSRGSFRTCKRVSAFTK
jgi:hypothetical protein